MSQPTKQGAITAINSTPTSAASANSAVHVDMDGKGAVTVQVTGTYTAAGGLAGQITVDGQTWVTLGAASTFTRLSTGVATAAITSGEQDVYQVSVAAGAVGFRVTAPGAVTGTATVSISASVVSLGGGASSGSGGGASTIADGADTATGAVADAAATAGGTGTVSAKLRRISTQLPSAVGQTTKSASMPVALASDDALLSLVGAPTAGTQSNVASSASDVTILASNSSRKGFYVFNDSTQVLYLLLSNATSSATVFTQKMAAGDSFAAAPGTYTGIVKGIWASANGSARVTEWA